MRLGIFGGTFDPPHIGHLILAAEARLQLSLDRLLWVLTPCPPHKAGQPITPVADRWELLQLALNSDQDFELSRVDIDRQPPHFAVETVELLRRANPGAILVYLMGGDSLSDLPHWHQPQAFVLACDELGVMRRPSRQIDLASLEAVLPGLTARVRFIDAPLLEISSSRIRQKIAEGLPYRYYLPPPVYQRIQERNLYPPPIQPGRL